MSWKSMATLRVRSLVLVVLLLISDFLVIADTAAGTRGGSSGSVGGDNILQTCCLSLATSSSSGEGLQTCLEQHLDSLQPESTSSWAVRNAASTAAVRENNILYITYISSNIRHYANYFLLLNLAYLEQQQVADIRVLSEVDRCNLSPSDQRWNKIPCLQEALTSWGKEYDYLVFFDADLLFLDWNYRVDEVIAMYPEADVIMAEDSLDAANTGMMLVRNTAWSKQLLKRWWSLKDSRNTFCDQHVLNKLSLLLEADGELERVRTVPYRWLNSKWPAIEHYQQQDLIIHLLGELSETRESFAKYLVGKTCRQTSTDVPIKRLAIHPQELVNIKNDTVVKLLEAALEDCNEINVKACSQAVDYLQHYCSWLRRSKLSLNNCNAFLHKVDRQFTELIAKPSYRDDYLATELELWDIKHGLKLYEIQEGPIGQETITLMNALLQDFDNFIQYSASSDEEKIQFQHEFRSNVFYEVTKLLIVAKRWSHCIHFAMIAISETSTWLESQDASGDEDVTVQSMIMKYIELSHWLSKAYLQTNKPQDAMEWCSIAVNNLNRLRRQYQGEDRLLVNIAKDTYHQCAEVHLNHEDQDKYHQFKEYASTSRYFANFSDHL